MAQQPGATLAHRTADRPHHASSDLPRTGYVRESTVLRHIPWGRSTLWSKAKKGEFPKPVKLSKRITAWRVEDVRAWIDAQARAS